MGRLLLAAQMNDACEEADEDAEFFNEKGVIVRHLAWDRRQIRRECFPHLLKTYGERFISV